MKPASPAPTVQQLRDRHHRVAQLVADGVPDEEVARAMDLTLARLAMLKNDPSFRELVAGKKKESPQ